MTWHRWIKNWCIFRHNSANKFKSFFVHRKLLNIDSLKSLFVIIQWVMILVRFQQIKRYFKMSNLNNESNFYDSDWWKKLKFLATDFQKISQKLYVSRSQVSINEQLILFKKRLRHILKLIAKEIDKSFKIYSLCERNYSFAFLFVSKVSWMKN